MAVPFAVNMALGALGLNDAQKTEVTGNTIPALDDLITWYNTHPDTVKAVIADVQRAAKGIGYVMDAMAGKGTNLSGVLRTTADMMDQGE